MSVRNRISESPVIIVGMLFGLAVFGCVLYVLIKSPNLGTPVKTFSYYTIDDGASFFPDDRPLSTPFQKDGKNAILAAVFTCDSNRTQFCGYLVKQAPAPANTVVGKSVAPGQTRMMKYIKKPGDTEWIPESDHDNWTAIESSVKCPEGAGEPIRLTPAGLRMYHPLGPQNRK